MYYVVFLGTLSLISTWHMKPSLVRRLIYAGLAVALIAVGVSRIYLGAHWLGDVLGGYAFGAAVVAFVAVLWRIWIEREKQALAQDKRFLIESGQT